MDDSQNTAVGAMGAVLGYVGAEAATPAHFERLMWPQRSHAGFGWRHILRTALLTPGGGPIYKAALEVLDNAFRSGLFRGDGLGQMLGTSFFPCSDSTYTMHCELNGHTEPSRNCMWERVMSMMPVPKAQQEPKSQDTEAPRKRSRAQVAVHHLRLSVGDIQSATPLLSVRSEPAVSIRSIFGIFASEILGIIFAVVIAAVWKSWLAIWWLMPLAIKILFAISALDRESLILDSGKSEKEQVEESKSFEVKMQLKSGTLLLITGPPSLVLQFFRHFGHPIRHRLREISQLSLIVASALLFPLGLVFSVTIMPEEIQYVWISYQMYLVAGMFVARFLDVSLWSSTEEIVAKALLDGADEGALLWGDGETKKVVKAQLETTWHDRLGDARKHFGRLLDPTDSKEGN